MESMGGVTAEPQATFRAAAIQAQTSATGSNPFALVCVLALAAGLRFWVAHLLPNIVWPDEIYQTVEPAHRLVDGHGLIPWEYVVGMRSWLFPSALAGALWAGRLFGTAPEIGLTAVQLFMIAFSLVPVAVAYRWGERLDGMRGGLIVGGIAAVWVDLIYFAPHPLPDVIASDVMMAGLYAALPLTTQPSLRRLSVAGALLSLAFVLRMQLGPGLLVASIFACGRSPKAWGAIVLGGLAVLLPAGCLDWITLGTPFQSIWLNFWLNVAKGVSVEFGVESPAYFPTLMIGLWGIATTFLVVTQLVIGGRRFPALLAAATAILAAQSIFQHKELRFVYPAYPLLITLCGIATVCEIKDFQSFIGKRFSVSAVASASSAITFGALMLWAFVSFTSATRPGYQAEWTRRRELISAFALASRQPGLCGVELLDVVWPASPGSTALPAGVPIYNNVSRNAWRDSAGYNVAIVHHLGPMRAAPFAFHERYRRAACFDGTLDIDGKPLGSACVWVRSGGCVPGVAKIPQPIWPTYFQNKDGSPRLDRIRTYAPGFGSQ